MKISDHTFQAEKWGKR